VLDGTGATCQIAAWACLRKSNFTVLKAFVFEWNSDAINLVLALIMNEKE